MKSKLPWPKPKRGHPHRACGHTPIKTLLLSLPWIASAQAQNALWPCPEIGVPPEPGLARHLEPMPGLPTGWSLGAGQGADLGARALAMASPEVPAQRTSPTTNVVAASDPTLYSGAESIWQNGVGEGFRSTTASFGVSAGALGGINVFGGNQHHDLGVVSLDYGHMLGPTLGEGHWYRGNPEFRLELFSGGQWHPETQWFVGLTPHLRYNFATGTRWIPFFDIGAGVTATGIGAPDLSGTFEFNLQGGVGVQWFIKDNVSISAEARYVHWSCAGINHPNDGLNGVEGLLGIHYFF